MKIIKKPASFFKVEPNLKDYDRVYQSFSWQQAGRELNWLGTNKLNAADNAIDRHAQGQRKNKIALYWEGEKGEEKKFTFLELYQLSNKFANLLKENEAKKGERVFFFLPRVPELYFGFLGTLKIGAIAGTLFSAFGPQALQDRLDNSGAKILITNKELYPRVKKIIKNLPRLKKILLIDDHSFSKSLNRASEKLEIAKTNSHDPAFMLYTSGTTGKPKGIVHLHQAILQEHLTAKFVLDIKDSDVYWCTADPGWVTGIAYEILGTWSNGASTLVYEGRFNPEKWYQLIEKYKVSIWYTAPTAIRMLSGSDVELTKKFDLSSLRHLASVGEPLNPQPIFWGLKAFGLPFHDNYWQTETGGIVIANYPSMSIKPGSMGKPVPGVKAAIINDQGQVLANGQEGNLALKKGWPSLMAKIWRRPKKYQSYFKHNWYITGDRAYRDQDGYFWFVSRSDDVIKTAGERVGPFEVESALMMHPAVIEAGVIGKPNPLRGQIIKAFIVLKRSQKSKAKSTKYKLKLIKQIIDYVKKNLAGHAYPREIEFVDKLPKTRSGKIMRRILKAKELGEKIGDTSTLEEY